MGTHRHTISRWLVIDAARSLEALLQTGVLSKKQWRPFRIAYRPRHCQLCRSL
jgi:hypothetical protein